MPKPESLHGQTRPASLDVVDVFFFAGLVCLLFGLGLAIGWGWGLAAIGLILVAYAVWISEPVTPKEGQ